MSQKIEIPKLWLQIEATAVGIPVKKVLGKLGIFLTTQDLVLQRKYGLELLPWGSGAGSHGDAKEKSFF